MDISSADLKTYSITNYSNIQKFMIILGSQMENLCIYWMNSKFIKQTKNKYLFW